MLTDEQPVQMPRSPEAFDEIRFIVRYERGECSDAERDEGIRRLLDADLAFRLLGDYRRDALALIAGPAAA